MVIDASNASDASGIARVEFDLGGDGTADWTGSTWNAMLPPGTHVIHVTAYDAYNNTAVRTCIIEVLPSRDEGSIGMAAWLTIPIITITALFYWKKIMHKRSN